MFSLWFLMVWIRNQRTVKTKHFCSYLRVRKLVFSIVFDCFQQKSLTSIQKTNFSHISRIRVRFQDFLKVAFIVFFCFSQVLAYFASKVLVLLVFSTFFDGSKQRSKKSDGKTNFSHISRIRVRFHPSCTRLDFNPPLEPTY